MYCSGLKEEGQVPLHCIGTSLCSLITFASTTFCAFSLPSSPVPSSLGLWEPSCFLFLFFRFFLASLHLLTGPQNKDSSSVYLQQPSFVCVFPSLHSHIWPQPVSWIWVSCRLSRPLASAGGKLWSGLGLVPSCVWGGRHHILSGAREGPSLYPDRALLQNMSTVKGLQKWHLIKALTQGQGFNYF